MSAQPLMIQRPPMINKMEELILASLIVQDGSTTRQIHTRIAAVVDVPMLDVWWLLNDMVARGMVGKQQGVPGTSPYWIEHSGRLALKRAVITTWVIGGTGLARL